MKKLRLYIRAIYIFIISLTLILYIFSPKKIIVHFNNGLPDRYGNKISLFVFSIFTIIVGEIGISFFKFKRKKNGLEDSPILSWQEIRFFQIVALIVLVFLIAMIHQLIY
ncbi:DUF1648 domain-containing protein [Streptococcus dysgalactiae]|uniref:DUF1648 domain-containing protein n=1 Tax=Streptococcus dysgalactiae TaxID=1334 RepID=UPI000E085CAE|nr:DUF1648 domain-containing protein [Streptococcus dysgalactiae]QQT03750.1 DUF1648 domain-containing protein [Streptococcus dysgalactiae]SUN46934.1 Predicted integral membrane protein [Streptococcus dysgalactiae subsp. dysgalactiae]SUN51610.1 Predicted integral membrane protein [Streptococcus dysgalactiae]SUN55852.1 Predicted integral membrane protein [Streptococcus dysgalactiae]VDZ40902.1 Predicted integral membrane protein [Streptococcus dysgalactiae subsp. dysgalactiae]